MNPSQPGHGLSVELSGIEKAFGAHIALAPLDFQVKAGEFLTIVGPSGCGKTTLMRLLAGLEAADAGVLRLGNKDVTSLPASQRDVALVFQLFTLYPHLNAVDNVTFSLRAQGVTDFQAKEVARAWLNRFELDYLANRRPKSMSPGERQKVALCRALVRQPGLFLFDEPLSAFDAGVRRTAWKSIRGDLSLRGATSILVTHDQDEAMALGDRVAVMREGRVEQCDLPKVIYDRPANLFVADFIGEPGMNLLPAIRRGEWVELIDLPMRLKIHEDRKFRWSKSGGEVPCVVGIRPEWVAVVDQGAAVMVDQTMCMGSANLLTLKANRHTLKSWVPNGVRFPTKSQVQVDFMASACHCFDQATGERLPWRVLEVQCRAGN